MLGQIQCVTGVGACAWNSSDQIVDGFLLSGSGVASGVVKQVQTRQGCQHFADGIGGSTRRVVDRHRFFCDVIEAKGLGHCSVGSIDSGGDSGYIRTRNAVSHARLFGGDGGQGVDVQEGGSSRPHAYGLKFDAQVGCAAGSLVGVVGAAGCVVHHLGSDGACVVTNVDLVGAVRLDWGGDAQLFAVCTENHDAQTVCGSDRARHNYALDDVAGRGGECTTTTTTTNTTQSHRSHTECAGHLGGSQANQSFCDGRIRCDFDARSSQTDSVVSSYRPCACATSHAVTHHGRPRLASTIHQCDRVQLPGSPRIGEVVCQCGHVLTIELQHKVLAYLFAFEGSLAIGHTGLCHRFDLHRNVFSGHDRYLSQLPCNCLQDLLLNRTICTFAHHNNFSGHLISPSRAIASASSQTIPPVAAPLLIVSDISK